MILFHYPLKRKKYIVISNVIIAVMAISIMLSSCSLQASNNNETKANSEEVTKLGYQIEQLIGSLNYSEAVNQLESNYNVVKNSDKLLASYAFIEFLIYQDYKKAGDLINKSIDLDPSEYNSYMLQGYIFQASNKHNKAIESFEKAIANCNSNEGLWSPEISNAYKNIGDSFIALHEEKKALTAYEKGVKFNPYNIELNAKMHRLYVVNEEYDKAYGIWKIDNFVEENEENEENIYKNIDEWNELYKSTIQSKTPNKHYQLAQLYDTLILYDEAKLEYERALLESNNTEEIKNKLNEIEIYLTFREDFKNILDNYYRARIMNGPKEELSFYQNLEPAYKKVSVLFPELKEKKNSTNVWIDMIDKEIEKKFNVRIKHIRANRTMLGSHFGRIYAKSQTHAIQWGKEIDLEVIVLKNMVTNGLDTWRTLGNAGVGGWSGSSVQVVRVIQNSENDNIIDIISPSKEKQDKLLEEIGELNGVKGKKSLDLYYSYNIAFKFLNKQMEVEREKAKKNNVTPEKLNSYLFNRIEKGFFIKSNINVHESQHSIDNKNNFTNSWFGENEYRAKLSQLAYGDLPYLNLATFYNPSIDTEDRNTHSQANTQVYKDFVQYIYDHSEEFPKITKENNILEQLTKLEEEDIKMIAINIFEKKYPDSKY